MVETVRTSCIRCRPRPGTRAQHTTSALATSSAATRSMISGSSVSTRIALASQSVHGGGHPWELQGKANLILVLEAHATAHSAAPGARLQDGLERPSHHDVDGRPRTIFGPERLSPTGDIRDFWVISRASSISTWQAASGCASPWCAPIGVPHTDRSRAYAVALRIASRATPRE